MVVRPTDSGITEHCKRAAVQRSHLVSARITACALPGAPGGAVGVIPSEASQMRVLVGRFRPTGNSKMGRSGSKAGRLA